MSTDVDKLWQYRIKYVVRGSIETNYHYYYAHDACQAYDFQSEMAEHRNWCIDTKCIERRCPYAQRWIDETELVTELNTRS